MKLTRTFDKNVSLEKSITIDCFFSLINKRKRENLLIKNNESKKKNKKIKKTGNKGSHLCSCCKNLYFTCLNKKRKLEEKFGKVSIMVTPTSYFER